MPSVYVLNGPNLNLLGRREPNIYGHETLGDIEAACRSLAQDLGLDVVFRQTNAEGLLIDWIHEAREAGCAIIINPAALTHTSVAVMDALKSCDFPVIEVHLSNVHQRETFRHRSYVSLAASAVMAGFGPHGYTLALRHVAWLVRSAEARPGPKTTPQAEPAGPS